MSTKLSIDEIQTVVSKTLGDKEKTKEIMKSLQKVLDDEAAAKDPKPKKKYENVLVSIKDENADDEAEFLRYIVKIEEGSDHNKIPAAIRAGIIEHNITAKNDKSKVGNIPYGIEKVAKNKFKNSAVMEVNIVTKLPCITVQMEDRLK